MICLLKARGVRTIVASDFSAARRQLASRCGAEIVFDSAQESPYALELAISTVEKLQRLQVSWHHVWRAIDRLGVKPKRPVVFECAGCPVCWTA